MATEYSYSFGEGFANGDATRFLDAEGFTRLHKLNPPPQVAKTFRFNSPRRRILFT
ncbi:MAG: hypothetical protein KME42_26635 [Tildeniella nuda ZEHNDER 1965/U140]|nr:hypothetical protein [Tildeniella nuda ZEHNDER 1965/U140]